MNRKLLSIFISSLLISDGTNAEDNPKENLQQNNAITFVMEKNIYSFDSPIKVGKIATLDGVNQWIKDYIQSHYPDYQIEETSTYGPYKNYYLKLVSLKNKQGSIVTDKKGDILYIPFDISEYRAIFKKQHPELAKKIEKLGRSIRKNSKDLKKTDMPEGMDYRNPFVLTGKTVKEIKKAQEEIIAKDFSNYQEELRMIWLYENTYIERISLKFENQYVILNFDITAHMKEYLKTHQIKKTKLSEKITQIEKL